MSLSEQLDRLARMEPVPYPVVSLYLNTQPGATGRDQFQTFVRKEFAARSRTYPEKSPERESLDRDVERIGRYLEVELQPSANGVAIFACSAGELFEERLRGGEFQLERIVSTGQATPPGEWYDQPWAEWVLLLSGRAVLRFEGEAA